MSEINPRGKSALWTVAIIILIIGFIESTRQSEEVPAETCVSGGGK